MRSLRHITANSVVSLEPQLKKLQQTPIEAARNYAGQNGVSILLKGAPTVIADPDGPVLLNGSILHLRAMTVQSK